MKLSNVLIKKFEGCELEAYKCAAGVWTIGYGHTKDVQEDDKWTEEKADFMLWRELDDEYEHYVNSLVTVPINQCQFDALVCWASAANIPKIRNAKNCQDVITWRSQATTPLELVTLSKIFAILLCSSRGGMSISSFKSFVSPGSS